MVATLALCFYSNIHEPFTSEKVIISDQSEQNFDAVITGCVLGAVIIILSAIIIIILIYWLYLKRRQPPEQYRRVRQDGAQGQGEH